MNAQAASKTDDESLATLESRVGDLLRLCRQLHQENRDLRAEMESLKAAREDAEHRVHGAREQIEGMIQQLKQLESDG